MELNAFVQLVSEFRRDGDSEEEILEAFRVFDPQFTGVVSVAQLRQVMMNYWYILGVQRGTWSSPAGHVVRPCRRRDVKDLVFLFREFSFDISLGL